VPAGGGVDTITRIVTDRMRPALGQPLIVENQAGVSGSIAAETVFNTDPDGYTLLASQPAPITTNKLLYKTLNYDPAQLVPIAIMSHIPNVVLVKHLTSRVPDRHFICAYADARAREIIEEFALEM
jgi:tripartite-type tricarboxylate transporter receptor subunit TctC